ncbi:MAG: right-handed parallel beta-helix repeat-containing protein [Phycisphaerales bacterium]
MTLFTIGSIATHAAGQTTVGGPILDDTTWTAAGSPYQIVSLVVVGDDATLTIEPGVVVECGDGLGIDVGSASFGQGTLIARGTAAEPIVFRPSVPDPVPGQWRGVWFTRFAVDGQVDPDTGAYVSGSIVEHAEITFAGNALRFDEGVAVVRDAAMRECGSAIRANLDGEQQLHLTDVQSRDCPGGVSINRGRGHVLTRVDVSNGGTLLFISDAPDVTITGGILEGATTAGFRAVRTDLLKVESLRVERNPARGMSVSDSEDIEIRACVFVDNGDTGAFLSTVPRMRVIDCEFRQNISAGGLFNGAAGLNVFRGDDAVIQGCVFEGNLTRGTDIDGGALSLRITERASVIDADFEGNEAFGNGGAVHVEESPGATFSDVRFRDNVAGARGGAVHVVASPDAMFEASTFEGNAAADGGGVFVAPGSTGISFAGDPDARRFNAFAGNLADRGQDMFNNMELGIIPGPGDVDASNVCWGTLVQFEVQQRIWDGFDDPLLGFIVANPLVECGPACRADIDGDGALTIFDFLAFQNAFDAGDLSVADFDGDGALTIFDFLAFQNEFDAGC